MIYFTLPLVRGHESKLAKIFADSDVLMDDHALTLFVREAFTGDEIKNPHKPYYLTLKRQIDDLRGRSNRSAIDDFFIKWVSLLAHDATFGLLIKLLGEVKDMETASKIIIKN